MKGKTFTTKAISSLVLLVLMLYGIKKASAECTVGPPIRDGYRGRNVLNQRQTLSIIGCFRKCKDNHDCTAINYNEQTNKCEMLEGNALLIYPNSKFTFVGNGTVVQVGSESVPCPINTKPTELVQTSVSVNQNRTIATYTCIFPYTHTSGNPVVQCRNISATEDETEVAFPEWESPTIICKVVCPSGIEPTPLLHTTVTMDADRTTAEYTCNAPYVRTSGSTTAQCQATQKGSTLWEAVTIVCAVACPITVEPKEIQHATFTVNAGRTIVTYACVAPATQTSGSTIAQCATGEEFLEWQTATIVCKVVCPSGIEPTPLPHTTVTMDADRSTAEYTCNAPYVRTSGSTTAQCQETEEGKQWIAATIVCAVACPVGTEPNQIDHATVTVNPGRTTATYICNAPATQMSGSSTVQCMTVSVEGERVWQSATIVCEVPAPAGSGNSPS